MSSITIRNIPEDVHQALRARAAAHGRSTEAEIRSILAEVARPENRVKLGTVLLSIGQEAALTAEEAELFDHLRDRAPAHPVSFE